MNMLKPVRKLLLVTEKTTNSMAAARIVLVSLRPMIMVTTALQGSSLMVMGFVGVATAVLPSLGYTFRGFAQDYSLVVPVLLTMLVVTSYSHQGSAQQGDILTGVRPWPGI